MTTIAIILALILIIIAVRMWEYESCDVKAKTPCQHLTLEYDYVCDKCGTKVFVDYV